MSASEDIPKFSTSDELEDIEGEDNPFSNWTTVELYEFGRDCYEYEWEPMIGEELAKRGDAKYLFRAGDVWDHGIYSDIILEALLEVGDAETLYAAGNFWENSRYDSRILSKLIETGDAEYLYYAGNNWRDDRYDVEIGYALFHTGDNEWIDWARDEWPEDRQKDVSPKPSDLILKDKYLNENIPTF